MVDLMKHQHSAVKWAQFREHQNICGGILADDMGLGKTLVMIALMLADKRMELAREKENEPPVKRVCLNSQAVVCSSTVLQGHSTTDDYHSAGTLVVCPKSVMPQWAQEVASKVAPGAIKVLVLHENNRHAIRLEVVRSFDLIITSYNLLLSELKRFGKSSPLFAVHWNRVILDEAHIIRNEKSRAGISVCHLRARSRWALSGTLVQNRAIDMLALLRFLQVPHFQHLQQWKRYLSQDVLAKRRLNSIITPLILRRTKQHLQEIGDMPALPPLKVELICVQLSEPEMAVYQILSAICKRIFTEFLRQFENYSEDRSPQFINEIFDAKYSKIYLGFLKLFNYDPAVKIKGLVILVLLLRLRQFCCHPGLLLGVSRQNS